MKSLRRLFEILGKWKYHYIFSAVLLIISMGFRMLEPRVLQVAVDKVIVYFVNNGSVRTDAGDGITAFFYSFLPELKAENLPVILITLGMIYLFISLFRGASQFISSTVSSSSTEKAVKQLRDSLFSHLQKLPLSYHHKTPTGELIQRCTGDVETVRKFSSVHVVEVIRLSALFLGSLIMMLTINVTYALIAIAMVPFIFAGSLFFFKMESRVWRQHEKEQDKLTSIVQENITGIRVVKAFAKEKYEINKFTEQNNKKRSWGLKLNRLHRAYWPSSDIVVHLQIALSIFAGGYFVLSNMLTVGEYIALYSYATMVTWPMRRIGQLTSEMGMTSVAIERIYSILNSPEEDMSGMNLGNAPFKGKIEFRNVSFRYDNEDKNVLDNISFSISPGEKIALLGPTGSGKSTIISLLERFYEPCSGKILIDDMNISVISKKYLRNRIGIVLQNPFLFSASVKENIAYGVQDTDSNNIIESAKVAKIHHIIEDTLPESYDTVVGEKGVTLSGGQKQRLTIARTILSDPDILIFDDCTSSVDIETEYEIQKALEKRTKSKTTIIIAHRITSVQDCDRIIVLDKGKIIESGTHDELIKNNSFYKKIYDIQVSIEDEIESDMKQGNGYRYENKILKIKEKIN